MCVFNVFQTSVASPETPCEIIWTLHQKLISKPKTCNLLMKFAKLVLSKPLSAGWVFSFFFSDITPFLLPSTNSSSLINSSFLTYLHLNL